MIVPQSASGFGPLMIFVRSNFRLSRSHSPPSLGTESRTSPFLIISSDISVNRRILEATILTYESGRRIGLSRFGRDDYEAYLLAGLMNKRAGNSIVVDITSLIPPLAAIVLDYWSSDIDV